MIINRLPIASPLNQPAEFCMYTLLAPYYPPVHLFEAFSEEGVSLPLTEDIGRLMVIIA